MVVLKVYNIQIILFLVIAAYTILWEIAPRKQIFSAPGPRLLAEETPRLFELIRSIADVLGQDMP